MYLKSKKFAAMFLACLMLLSTATACGKKKEEEKKPSEKVEEKKPETKKEEGLTIKDAAGRTVKLKGVAKRVVTDSPETLRFYSYINGIEGVVGVSVSDHRIMHTPYAIAYPGKKNIKGFGGGYTIDNFEGVVLEKPDVIFSSSKDQISEYDKIQEQTGIPVVALEPGTGVVFDPKVSESLTIIGKVIGKEDRAKEVVEFMDSLKKDLEKRTKDIPENERKRAYVGGLIWNGPHGIEGTRENYPLFDVNNIKNVVTGIGKNGHLDLDKEKIMSWDPEYIILDMGSIHLIQDDFNKNKEYYKNLKAFKNKKVFGQIPFVAADVNVDTALADAYYIGKVVYPEKFQDVDPVKKADEIYSFMLKKPVYAEVAKNTFGGFQPVSLEDLEANKFFKEIKKKN